MGIAWAVGQKISASRLNRRQPVTATKQTDESYTSDIVPNDDPFLVLVLKANTTYDLFGCLFVVSTVSNTGRYQVQYAWTGTATFHRGDIGPANGLASGTQGSGDWGIGLPDSSTPGGNASWAATTSNNGVRINDRIEVGNADITLSVQSAQSVSSANPTTLKAGSWVTAIPVG